MNINEQEIRKALAILKPNGELVEIRIIQGRAVYSGYFTEPETLIKSIKAINLSGNCNVYFTLNQINKGCYSREQRDRFIKNPATTGDNDITGYKWLMIDFDPARPSKTSATDTELEEAHQRAVEVYKHLKGLGWAEPLIARSGNGYHLLYRLDFPASATGRKLVEDAIKTISILFGDSVIDIDKSVFNPSRVCKLYGTLAQKGANTEERPHRVAEIVKAPAESGTISPEQLKELIAELPEPEQPLQIYNNRGDYSGSGKKFDIDEFIAKYGIEVEKETVYKGGIRKIDLVECYFPGHHKHKASIFVYPDGAIGFKCMGGSCSDHHWRDFRLLFEPDAYNQSYDNRDYSRDYGKGKTKLPPVEPREEKPEISKEEYLKTSTANYIQNFVDGIADSVNTSYISTGFPNLDNALDGGLYEGLYTIGAISSLGKTTFILQIADQIAQSGTDVLIFSLEMARTELIAKSISRNTFQIVTDQGGDSRNAKTARGITTGARYINYSREERKLISEAIQAYSEYAGHIYISEGVGDIGVDEIRETVKKHILYTGNTPVVIVDYLQILAPYNDRATDKQNTDKAVLELKRISRDHKTAVIAISSFNRLNYKTAVTMEAYKESGAIEYSSDVLLGLQLKGAGGKTFDANEAKKKNPREVELVILKNRNGSTGDNISYEYYPLFNLFEES